MLGAAQCTPPPATIQQPVTDSTSIVSDQPAGGSEYLYASKWILSTLHGTAVAITQGMQAPQLAFFPGQVSRVSGYTGCNNLNGTFEPGAGNTIKFSPLATTRRACPGGVDIEQRFLKALQEVTHFSASENELLLRSGGKEIARFRALKDTASSTPGPLSQQRFQRLHERFLAGTDFHASGNEPFWSLEIDRQKEIRFTILSGDSITLPFTEPTRLQDVAASSYRLETKNGLLTAIIFDRPCVNDMSGDTLSKSVEVTYKNNRYMGCGQFLADYRLHDIWVLESMGDKQISDLKLSRGAPMLELNLTANRASGHSSCNGIGGRLEVEGHYISFSQMIGTMMACDDNGFERDYLKLLSQKNMPYEVQEGKLTIHSGNTALRYKKVD